MVLSQDFSKKSFTCKLLQITYQKTNSSSLKLHLNLKFHGLGPVQIKTIFCKDRGLNKTPKVKSEVNRQMRKEKSDLYAGSQLAHKKIG